MTVNFFTLRHIYIYYGSGIFKIKEPLFGRYAPASMEFTNYIVVSKVRFLSHHGWSFTNS